MKQKELNNKVINETLPFWKDQDVILSKILPFIEKYETDNIIEIIEFAIKERKYELANWLITKQLNLKQKVQYAIYGAELDISTYEKRYPNDKNPREGLESLKKFMDKPSPKNKDILIQASLRAYASAYRCTDEKFKNYALACSFATDIITNDFFSAADSTLASTFIDPSIEKRKKILRYGINLLKRNK